MPFLAAADGTKLAYHQIGASPAVVCLPGGPMQDSAYLGDLGGLELLRLDLRGTGQSSVPADTTSYRCDRLVDDVEALRAHLGWSRMNLLSHSGGVNLLALYAARYPAHVESLILVTPSPFAVGITITADMRREIVRSRAAEHPEATEAFERVAAGQATPDDWAAMAPLSYGRWDAAARAHHAAEAAQRNAEAAAVYGSEGAYDPPATRAALAALDVPVLLIAGGRDPGVPPRAVAEYAELFRQATVAVHPEAGHFPWLDDPAWFRETVTSFLATG